MPNIIELGKSVGMQSAYDHECWMSASIPFDEYIRGLLEKYKQSLNEVWETDNTSIQHEFQAVLDFTQKIVSIIVPAICDSVELCYAGKPGSAYKKFEDGIESAIEEASECNKGRGLFSQMTSYTPSASNLFRMRVKNRSNSITTRKDIFHLPFELRHKATPGRFSISGYPSLYLGGSLYTCWEEMGRPEFDSVFFSRFRCINNKIKVVLLSYEPIKIFSWINSKEFTIEDTEEIEDTMSFLKVFLSLWPIQLACAIPRKVAVADFHPEYIIPQLLMQWIMVKQKVHGICFRTTRVPLNLTEYKPDHFSQQLILNNYVFPSRQSQSHGYCQLLTDSFCLTEPQSWEYCGAFSCPPNKKIDNLRQLHNATLFRSIGKEKIMYDQTVFSKQEINSLILLDENIVQ